MLKFTDRDLFSIPCDALVVPVNCVGVMGKGVALRVKETWPGVFWTYRMACLRGDVCVGEVLAIPTSHGLVELAAGSSAQPSTSWILCFPTKKDWRDKSKLDWIDWGLDAFKRWILEHNTRSVAVPALGCGAGGLSWNSVKKLLRKKLEGIESCEITVCNHIPGWH